MKKLLYIARYKTTTVLLLLLLALAPAMAQNVVYQGQITQLGIEQIPGDTYEWELYRDSTVNFAVVPGDCPASDADFVGGNTGAAVRVEWKEPGKYFYKVTARNITGCANNLVVGIIKVLPSIPKAVIKLDRGEICLGESAKLQVTISGKGPWNMILQVKDLVSGTVKTEVYTDIPESDNPKTIDIKPKTNTEYTVIEVSNMYGVQHKPSNVEILTVHPLPLNTGIYRKIF